MAGLMSSPEPVRVTVIVNPVSGVRHGRVEATARVALAERVISTRGIAPDVRVTEGPGHARLLAREAASGGASIVFAWGGDGTVNEVASGLAFTGAALGIIPSGSGNGLARALGIPACPETALVHGLERAERTVDMGELGGSLFVNVAGLGLDDRVAARFATGSRRRGLLPYVRYTAAELLGARPLECEMDIDGAPPAHWRALVVALANSRQYGGGAVIAPDARLDDGLLNLVVVSPVPLTALIAGVPRLFRGTMEQVPYVTARAIRHLRIVADRPLLFHVDGEPVLGSTELEARVHPGALRVRA
jgi:diacylglycerol kinase (ATP)